MLQSKIFILLSCTYIFLRVKRFSYLTSLVFTLAFLSEHYFKTILIFDFYLFIYLIFIFVSPISAMR